MGGIGVATYANILMENDVFETIERMLSFSLGSHIDLRGADVDQIVRGMEDAFSSETCRFIFKYRQSRSINTNDIDTMIQDLYNDGYEVIMVVQDYIKRILSVENFRDQRHLELGAVVDDFSGLAKRYGIPFVTGMQLNREAYAKFETAIESGKMDAVKSLGASNVGESINVYENADVVIFQGRVTSEALEQLFLTVRLGKMRGKRKAGVDFFAQPFDRDENGDINEMRLVEDAHLAPNQIRGLREIGDGLTREYDANGGREGSGGSRHAPPPATRNERSATRSAAVLAGPGAGTTARGGGRGRGHAPPVRTSLATAAPPLGQGEVASNNARVDYAVDDLPPMDLSNM